MKRQSTPQFNGLLPVFKPAGPTSHDVVDIARRALRQREIGHTGTLDPAAEGLLILCLGNYTKLSSFLMEHDKTYEGHFALGARTDSDDAEGAVVEIRSSNVVMPSAAQIEAAAVPLRGKIRQVPPAYSAIKVDGKKLYDYARSGKTLQVEARSVTVYRFEVGSIESGQVPESLISRTAERDEAMGLALSDLVLWNLPFQCHVSSGTYIRSLARDLGAALGTCGYLAFLRRTSIGHIGLEQAMPAELLRESPDWVEEYLMHGTACIDTNVFPVVVLKREFERIMLNGQPVHNNMMTDSKGAGSVHHEKICVVTGEDGRLLGMAQAMRADAVKVKQAYVAPFEVAFRSTRIFPNGLK